MPKNKFSREDDVYLKEIVECFGCKDWGEVASYFPGRNARQCRERWTNYINPTIMKMPWTASEDILLERKHAELGAKWHVIAKFFPNRSKNYVKNRWLTKQRRLRKQRRSREESGGSQSAPVAAPPPPVAFKVKDDEAAPQPPSFMDEPLFLNQEEDDGFWSQFNF
jgi:hypothetical protein